MTALLEQSRSIRKEAEDILHARGLHAVLSKYGDVKYVGSYYLDLMLKRDIDISLINPSLTLEDFHQLGIEASRLLKPHSLQFRDTRIKPIANRPPEALYWAFVFNDWNIDLWLVDESYYQESLEYMEGIKNKLTDDFRERILEIKTQAMESGEYGRKFNSGHVYRAVLEQSVTTYEQFREVIEDDIS